MTLRDDLLPVINEARQIPDDLGLRRYSVTIRLRAWPGGKPGLGKPVDTDVLLAPRPRVRHLSAREIASSAGTYEQGDFKIEKITPAFVDAATGNAGGYTPRQIVKLISDPNQDTTVILVGDDGMIECTLVEGHFDEPFKYRMVVRERRTGAE